MNHASIACINSNRLKLFSSNFKLYIQFRTDNTFEIICLIIYFFTMTQKNSRGWTYSSSKNCYVAPAKDYASYPPLPSRKKSASAGKSITIKVKSEALTPANNLLHTHDTRRRKKKSERRLVIPVASPFLNLPNHARALALRTHIVPSPTKSP